MVAATASRHGLTAVTRNIRHFQHLDVAMQQPAGNL
jgi:predicted nucleic acid-binding protein